MQRNAYDPKVSAGKIHLDGLMRDELELQQNETTS